MYTHTLMNKPYTVALIAMGRAEPAGVHVEYMYIHEAHLHAVPTTN